MDRRIDPAVAFKVRENRIRRAASRQGFLMERNRRRDPRAYDFGLYRLVNVRAGERPEDVPFTLTLDEIAERVGDEDRTAVAA